MNGELEGIWKEEIIACFNSLPQHESGISEKNMNIFESL
jgi:hypothetical protein